MIKTFSQLASDFFTLTILYTQEAQNVSCRSALSWASSWSLADHVDSSGLFDDKAVCGQSTLTMFNSETVTHPDFSLILLLHIWFQTQMISNV